MSAATSPARLLLIEPEHLFRRVVVSVARDLDVASIEEASGRRSAESKLESGRFDGVFVALDDDGHMMSLLKGLREGRYPTGRDVPVVVMTDRCDQALVAAMKELDVRKLLLKPFKVKSVLESVAAVCAA